MMGGFSNSSANYYGNTKVFSNSLPSTTSVYSNSVRHYDHKDISDSDVIDLDSFITK